MHCDTHTFRDWRFQNTHTQTHMLESPLKKIFPCFSPPILLFFLQGQPGAVVSQINGDQGLRPRAHPCPGQGHRQERDLFCMVLYCCFFSGGNPCQQGENRLTPHRKARNTARLSREQCNCFRSRNNSSRSYSSSQSSTEEHGLRASQQFPLKSLPPPCFPVTMLSLK